MNIDEILNQLGFSKNETGIYLASLELGLSSASDIAKKARVKRTTAYSVLEYLVKRDIVVKSTIKNKTHFLAKPPEQLLKMVSDIYLNLSKKMPELNALSNVKKTKPKILFYEGDEAIKNVYDDTLHEKPNEILEWNTDKYFGHKVSRDYIKKRVELRIKARRMASTDSIWHKRGNNRDKEELAETLIMPKNKFDLDIEINIYNNRTAFINYAEEMSIIIESKAIADAMKQVYELSWECAKKYEIK